MDLARQILIEVGKASPSENIVQLQFAPSDLAKVSEHVYLLGPNQAGFLEIREMYKSYGKWIYMPERLTWQGQQFLNDIQNESRWKATKKVIATIGGASLLVAKQVATKLSVDQAEGILRKYIDF